MLNTNVGDMPLDIFSDYVSDILDQEWCWEYFLVIYGRDGYNSHGRGWGHGHFLGIDDGKAIGHGGSRRLIPMLTRSDGLNFGYCISHTIDHGEFAEMALGYGYPFGHGRSGCG
jgi:hypothetical protein